MKKKVLSPEALAALADSAKKADAEAAAAVEGQELESQEPVEPKAEGESHVEAEGSEGEGELPAPTAEEIKAELSAQHEAAIIALNATHAEAMESAKAQLEKEIAAKQEFKDIVAGHISVMRTALFLADVDLSAMDDSMLLKEYQAICSTFEKSLPVGGVVPKAEAKAEPAKMSNREVGAVNALGF